MPNLIDRLKRIRARCTKPTKDEREHGCCGYLLTHAGIETVVQLYDAAQDVLTATDKSSIARLERAVGRMRESHHAG